MAITSRDIVKTLTDAAGYTLDTRDWETFRRSVMTISTCLNLEPEVACELHLAYMYTLWEGEFMETIHDICIRIHESAREAELPFEILEVIAHAAQPKPVFRALVQKYSDSYAG
ncbi:hypothetical protein [Paenibacillus tarimensis]|uniref:hypothetical protein n=1 Tax=Paenibacillus tarimensis TaxID=416012 RepID=UPI001F39B19B|nr:hypothetical protein [Paenibacillus tarimensis]MCF2944577.1 hypothetical protein [Paenibacillus tarimensis]